MGTRAEQKRKTRQSIVDAALVLSVDRGFSSISLREVTARAGIAPTSFYRHFKSMEELGLAIVDEVGRSLRELVREARKRVVAGETSATRASIGAFFDYLSENGDMFRLTFGQVMAGSPPLRRAVNKEIERFVDDLSDDLRAAARLSGRPLANIPLIAEAMTWLAFNRGIQALDLEPERRIEARDRIIAQVRVMLRGAEAEAAGWEPE